MFHILDVEGVEENRNLPFGHFRFFDAPDPDRIGHPLLPIRGLRDGKVAYKRGIWGYYKTLVCPHKRWFYLDPDHTSSTKTDPEETPEQKLLSMPKTPKKAAIPS